MRHTHAIEKHVGACAATNAGPVPTAPAAAAGKAGQDYAPVARTAGHSAPGANVDAGVGQQARRGRGAPVHHTLFMSRPAARWGTAPWKSSNRTGLNALRPGKVAPTEETQRQGGQQRPHRSLGAHGGVGAADTSREYRGGIREDDFSRLQGGRARCRPQVARGGTNRRIAARGRACSESTLSAGGMETGRMKWSGAWGSPAQEVIPQAAARFFPK